jgi:hypothetical protein
MNRLEQHRSHSLRWALSILGLAVLLLACAPLASLAVAWEAHACQGAEEFPTVCIKAIGSSETSAGLIPERHSPVLAKPVVEFLLSATWQTPGALRPTPAWSVRAPPGIL